MAVCDVEAVEAPDAVTIDALARLQLTAQRMGCRVELRHAGPALLDLLVLTGLAEVIPLSASAPPAPPYSTCGS